MKSSLARALSLPTVGDTRYSKIPIKIELDTIACLEAKNVPQSLEDVQHLLLKASLL